MERDEHAAGWKEWLRLSNLLALRTIAADITTSSLLTDTPPDPRQSTPAADFGYPDAWRLIVGTLPKEHEPFARELATAGAPVPVIGLETDEGAPVDFAWPTQLVAASPDWDTDTREELDAAGWSVFDADVDAVLAALTTKGN